MQWSLRGFPVQIQGGLSLTVDRRAQSAVHSALTTRIILNIRKAASQRLDDFSFDLHLSDTDSNVNRSRLSFAQNLSAFYYDDDHSKSDIVQRSGRAESVASMAQVGMVSVSASTTVSRIALPVTRDARGKWAVGRIESDDEEGEDEKVSIRTSPEEWV